jgi:hypothetical protein
VAYALVGDVVESRRYAEPGRLVDGLADVLAAVNGAVETVQPLALVVRDEFHGVYDRADRALEAILRLRLLTDDLVLPTVEGGEEAVDVRVGIGHGEVVTAGTGSQTGAAWWHAHDARRAAQDLASRPRWPGSLRTVLHDDDPVRAAQVNAHLLLQDQLLARMDASDRRALRGLLDGERQVDIAADLGVSQPAVARRVRDRGALAIAAALTQLREAEHAASARPAPTSDAYASRHGATS